MDRLKQTLILNHQEIQTKINRMAWQILENNHDAKELVIIGIEKRGSLVGDLITATLRGISDIPIKQGAININKEKPNLEDTLLRCDATVNGAHVVLVDDVLNSGKTLMYATLPILTQNPAVLQTAVLANRDHTNFPIKADFVGISLATTLREHINFTKDEAGEMSVYLT